ncbi:cytochrome c556 [Pseudochelatococcus lubricantis]|uniref:Cytochrome c556 n=1 Tax=Pseudochelatococcus lubricantis TaxID=1538102 RepID=A0ABX0V4R6_9HYPH|nr:cytochrome c [Pseudochelatococcus lubricantis]NIJ58086.1 cytochrome c556 [Pseudochelatococcus lubricantis]
MLRKVVVAATVAAGVVAYGAGSLLAQTDVIAERQALMKQAGGATRTGSQIAKGELPFDEAKAKEIFAVYQAVAEKAPALFPEGSDKGDTTAAPTVWTDKAGFEAQFAAFGAAAKQGAAAAGDLDGFKTAFAAISQECGVCHQTFRVKK